jgi:RNA polymerase sigma-70 factor (ECF subfamily)
LPGDLALTAANGVIPAIGTGYIIIVRYPMELAKMTENIQTDERLCTALVANLESGFEALVLAYQHRLYGFALRLSGNAQDAEEIAQDAFVRAYRALMTYTPPQTATLRLRPWLFQIALNVFRNRIRGAPRAPHQVPLDTSGEADLQDRLIAGTGDQPEQAVVNNEGERLLTQLISALPEHFRIAIVLRHIEGLSYSEMAALLGQPAGTLKAHVHRGVKQLRVALDSLPLGSPYSSDQAAMSEVR